MVLLGEVGVHATFQLLMVVEVDLVSLPLKRPQGEEEDQPPSSMEAAEVAVVVVAAAAVKNQIKVYSFFEF